MAFRIQLFFWIPCKLLEFFYYNCSHCYRLKQIDFDGAYEYSDMVSVDLSDNPTASQLLIYPNPAKERLHLRGIQAEQARIVDHLGRRMPFRLMDDNSIDISNLETGLYLLTIDTGQEVISRRFVKE